MKKMMTLVMMMAIAISAAAMPYNTARNEALYLSDKMAYELGLTATQYEAVYEINLDYLLNIDTRADVFGFWWEVRNRDLRYVLSTWQYDRFMASEWFYRPIIWTNTGMTFSIYSRYGVGRMFFDRPAVFVTFKGGHSHRSGSFYSGHHYDKPNPPRGHGNHNNNGNHNNGGWNHNGNHNNGNHNGNSNHNNGGWNHNGNHNNGNHNGNSNHNNGGWNHNGNHNNGSPNSNSNHNNNPSTGGGHRTTSGNGNHNPSVGGFSNSHGSGTVNAPSRTGSRASGNLAGSGSTSRGTFGRSR
ncbi:MAG: hypothetical protein J5548_07665 [Prevotella sp.]|nr:hypothetical protein [Prevotella sp.]